MAKYVARGDDPLLKVDEKALSYAAQRGWVVVNLVVVQDDENDGDLQCVLVAPAVPRTGEQVVLEDQTVWLVKRVDHVVTKLDGFPVSLPNVFAIQVSGGPPASI